MILCVERDPYVRELETFFLTEAGFSVTFADDGLKALELAQQLHPNVIITEILVPRLDGLALCRRLKSDPATSDIAVLVFSALIGMIGTVASIYLSFSALDVAENSGIGAVGDHIRNALLFTVGGIIGCLIGLVLFFVGRAKN